MSKNRYLTASRDGNKVVVNRINEQGHVVFTAREDSLLEAYHAATCLLPANYNIIVVEPAPNNTLGAPVLGDLSVADKLLHQLGELHV